MASRPAALREALRSGACIAAPGVSDALGARIAARAGHRVLYLGGNAMALALGKGQPFLTATETAEVARRVSQSVDIPALVDAGAGFGGPAHLDIVVREIEAAGAGGLHLDDQPYPKPAAYHRGAGSLVAPDAMAGRLRVAAAARRDPAFPIVARTDALRVTRSVDETIGRCRAYVAAGADALMVLDLGPAEAEPFRNALPDIPLLWIGGVVPPVPSLQALGAAGFALACYPFSGVAAVTDALTELWTGLARTGEMALPADLLARARSETLALVDMQRAWDLEEQDGQA